MTRVIGRFKIMYYSKRFAKQNISVNLALEKYDKALTSYNRTLDMQYDIMRESMINGETDHRIAINENIKLRLIKEESDIKVAKRKYEKEQKELKAISSECYRRINNIGKLYAVSSIFLVSALYCSVYYFRTYINTHYISLGINIDNFFVGINKDFYNLCAQIIITLTVALFISKHHKNLEKRASWLSYSRFSVGVTWALFGLAACLYVVGGDTPGVYTFSVVAVSVLVLLYSAISPLISSEDD